MRGPAVVLVVLSWAPVAWGVSASGISSGSPTNTPIQSPTAASCLGDCDNRQFVTDVELLTMVDIALGNTDLAACAAGDPNRDQRITVDEILGAVNNASTGCGPRATPTPSPTGGITYHLLLGFAPSLFTFSAPGTSVEDILSGTFVAVPGERGQDGVFLHFLIASVDFHGVSPGATDIGTGIGDISASITTGQLAMALTVPINGQQIQLTGEVPLALGVVSDEYPPTFFRLEACGAPGRAVRCEDFSFEATGYYLSIAAAPEATQTPLPTRTPLTVTYQLTAGSTILFAPSAPGPSPPSALPLSGSFEVIEGPPLQADSRFRFIFTRIQFESSAFTITGSMGDLEAVPATIELTMSVSINGQPVDLIGKDPLSVASDPSFTYPPIYSGLTVGSSGYSLTIFAVPVR